MADERRIIKLKLDIIFKQMFGDAKNESVIANFLSGILEIPRGSIKKIIMENVELVPDYHFGKFCRLDLKMQVDDKIVNIEMQLNNHNNFRERTLYYWSRVYSDELKESDDYGKLRDTICINIVNFNLFDCENFHSHFKVMEKERHEVLTDTFAIHFFELKKLGKNPDKNNMMKLWLQLVNAETEEELEMLENTGVKEIREAIVILRELNADEKMRQLAFTREKAIRDEANAINSARAEGIAEGRAKGIAEGEARGIEKGRVKAIASVVEKMKARGMSDKEINEILSEEI